jgi:phage baseplate assembly protein W
MIDLTKDILLDENLDLDFSRPTNEIENIKQHIMMRLLVQKGEEVLTPDFGSNLFKKTTVEEIVTEVVNALSQEPRVEELGKYTINVENVDGVWKLTIEFEKVIGKIEITF